MPNISIPLFDIKSGDLELPISLSYHASGVKVAQEASWVGLGWSLNAGGVITRQVRHLDDFGGFGYLSRSDFPPSTEDNLPDFSDPNNSDPNNTDNFSYYDRVYYEPIQYRIFDGEPDVFYYNFLGQSGKIIFEKQSGDVIQGVSTLQNDLKFSYTKSTRSWVVTDGNGMKYYFGNTATEKTSHYHYNRLNAPIIQTDNITGFDDEIDPDIVDSSWYINKVESVDKDEILFRYENLSHKLLGQIQYSELEYTMLSHDNIKDQGVGYISSSLAGSYKLYSASQQVTEDVYLTHIEFNNGKLVFLTDDRIDIRTYNTSPKSQRLKSVELFDLEGSSIKKTDFNYSYMNENKATNKENWLRLKLDSFQESYNNDNIEVKKPPYKFTYNALSLPEKTSYETDYWGYFNGQNNNSVRSYSNINLGNYINSSAVLNIDEETVTNSSKKLIPFIESNIGEKVFVSGANREVAIDKMQAGILTSIKYPLGGITNFVYEPNDYYSDTEQLYENKPQIVDAYYQYDEKEDAIISLDKYTLIHLNASIFDPESDYDQNKITMRLEKENGDGIISIKPNEVEEKWNWAKKFVLPPGNYRLNVDYAESSYIYLDLTAKYIKKIPTNNKIGAGVRIDTITVIDKDKTVKKSTYSYQKNETSTGRLMSPLQHFYNETLINENVIPEHGTVIHYIYKADYLVRNSNSVIPLGTSAQGNPIGYDQVVVSNIESSNENQGYSEYFYRNEEEVPIELFMPGASNFIHLNNGQLLSKIDYNKQGDTIKKHFLSYKEDQDSQINLKGTRCAFRDII